MTVDHGASITSSERMAASDSTISTRIGGTGNHRIQIALGRFGGGRVQHVLAVHVTRGLPIGPPNGMPEMARAAEAPIMATMSEKRPGSRT